MLCRRLVLLLVCVCCLVVVTHSTGLLLGLAALKGAVLGKKFLLKGALHKGGGGRHYGYVSHGSYYQPPPPQPLPIYPPYPQYQTSHVHYHTGQIPHYHYVQGHVDDHSEEEGGYGQGFALTGQYYHQGWQQRGHGSYSYGGGAQKGHSIYRRSLRGEKKEEVDVGENLLLTTVTQLDQEECILKLVCSLQTKPEKERTPNEAVLASIFTDSPSSSSYTAAFVHAAGVGRQEQDSTPCNRVFSKCVMEETDLRRALDQAWGCADWNDV